MSESFRKFLLSNSYAIQMTSRISLIAFIVLAFLGPIIPFHGFMFFLILLTFVVLIASVKLEGYLDEIEEDEISDMLEDAVMKLHKDLAKKDNYKECENCDEKSDCETFQNKEKDEQPT